jgi:hypothetical protein
MGELNPEQVHAEGLGQPSEGCHWRYVPVVKFLDNRVGQRWFYRSYQELGRVVSMFEGSYPCDPNLLDFIREHYGQEVSAIY